MLVLSLHGVLIYLVYSRRGYLDIIGNRIVPAIDPEMIENELPIDDNNANVIDRRPDELNRISGSAILEDIGNYELD